MLNTKKENDSFVVFDNTKSTMLFDQSNHEKYPIKYYNAINSLPFTPSKSNSYYVYVYKGNAILSSDTLGEINLKKGMYFSVSGEFNLKNNIDIYQAIIIEVMHNKGVYPETNYSAVNTIGGPIEEKGRLNYIDGCTDSLLIPPVKMGDPCFNHLHFPEKIDQTPHTHPSHRIGIVAKGTGECITPFGNLPLFEDMIFVIKEWDGVSKGVGLDGETYPSGTHSFKTFDGPMDVIAFHPDSDFGATDINHPMINRTIVDGVSANQIEDIRTK